MTSGVNESLRNFIQQRMTAYDSDISTEDGSDFDRVVLTPLLARLGPDTTETDAEQIIIDRIREHDPAISTEVGSGIRDGLITPLSAILEPFRRAVNLHLLRGSWENVESLTEEEANILAENVFYTRDEGDKATGIVRLKFASPRSVSISLSNVAYSGSLRFVPTNPQTISRLTMQSQVSGSYYYMDVSFIAEKAGDEYNVPAGSISSVDSVTGVVGVEQISDFTSGRSAQTNLELKEAAQQSIVVRNLVTERSILTVLPDQNHYPGIGSLLVTGRMDPAMSRDLVYGPASIGGMPQGIKGGTSPDILVGDKYHIGGFTDIWAAPSAETADVSESIDVENLYDEGALVFSSTSGAVNAGTPDTLEDIRAFFSETDEGLLPVQVGDILIVEGQESAGQHTEYTVDTVNPTSLVVSPDIVSGLSLSDVAYEVRRRETGYLQLSLDTLVPEDSDGDSILDSSGNPYLPVPGLEKESEGVLAASNKGTGNVSLPLLYIDTIEFLDPVSDQPTGVVIPEADPIAMYVSDRVSDDQVWVRVVYRHATRFLTGYSQEYYTLEADAFYLPLNLSGAVSVTSTTVATITGVDYTDPFTSNYANRTPQPGDLLTIYDPGNPGVAVAQSVIVTVNYGGMSQTYEVEEAVLPTGISGHEARITQGSRQSDMTDTDELGFSYFEFIAQRSTGTKQPIGTSLASPTGALNAQGWRVLPRLEGYSFSTYEEPLLRITNTVNDSTSMSGTSVRITYTTTPLLREIQDFLDQDSERVPAEDLLVRRMPAARVHIAIHFTPDSVTSEPAVSLAESLLTDYVRGSVSDASPSYGSATRISNVLEDAGADKVAYPFSTIVEYSGKARSGQEDYGKLMSFHSYDGFSVPEGVSSAIESLFRMAHYIPGAIEAIED